MIVLVYTTVHTLNSPRIITQKLLEVKFATFKNLS